MSTSTRTPSAQVSTLRTLSILLAFTAAVGLVFGTAGFSTMEADRGLTANVTDDGNAYLGYDPVVDEGTAIDENEPTDVVEFRNQFDVDLTEFRVDVSAQDPDVSAETVDPPESLPKGNGERIAVTLRCDVESETTVPLQFSVNGSGGGVSVSFDRTHTVTCVPEDPDITGVEYHGVGSASVDSEGSNATTEAVVWLTDANPSEGGSEGTVRSETVSNLNASKPVQSQLPPDVRDQNIVAIEFPERGVAYFHPGWNGENHGDPGAGPGVRSTEVPLDTGTVTNTSVVSDD